MLCCSRMCLARASDRVNDLTHSKWYLRNYFKASDSIHLPGRRQMNGFSPVCDRMWDMRAKRDVCGSPLRRHELHSQV